MSEVELVPDADLMESMRAIGYSLSTSIADLCDNSVAAEASQISIRWAVDPFASVSILDNGWGMDEAGLLTAMKLAGKSPLYARQASDLGRFGLGLKTASLAQARCLTVVSKGSGGKLVAAVWDLDFLQLKKKWILQIPSIDEIRKLPRVAELEAQATGTLVVWQNLDLLVGDEKNVESALLSKFSEVAGHLSLVFHRFLSAKAHGLQILVNDQLLKPVDPFLEGQQGVLEKHTTQVKVSGDTISVTPFILPSVSKMTQQQRKTALIDTTLKQSQGFYIYRNRRLLTWGTWFRMVSRSEGAKLARVRVDISNRLDAEWRLGIMKSSVVPPVALREALRALVPNIVAHSQTVAIGKSRVVSHGVEALWQIRDTGPDAFSVEINRDHPLVSLLSEPMDSKSERQFSTLLDLLETQFPGTVVHSRLSQDYKMGEGFQSEVEIAETANVLFEAIRPLYESDADAWSAVLDISPFCDDLGLQAKLKAHLSKGL